MFCHIKIRKYIIYVNYINIVLPLFAKIGNFYKFHIFLEKSRKDNQMAGDPIYVDVNPDDPEVEVGKLERPTFIGAASC